MKTRTKKTLARLASEAFAERYVLHASAEEYVLPEEVVDQACSAAEAALSISPGGHVFTGSEREALERFATLGRKLEAALPLDEASVSNEQLLHSQAWIDLRSAAQECLRSLGVSSSEWEKDD